LRDGEADSPRELSTLNQQLSTSSRQQLHDGWVARDASALTARSLSLAVCAAANDVFCNSSKMSIRGLEASRSGDFQSPFVKGGRFQIAPP
jgi:hypothetical protein